MKRFGQIVVWLVRLALVIILIQFPLKQATEIWQAIPTPLAGKVIVLDPGHGGADGGAQGKDKTEEKDISLEVAKKTRDYLQQAGALVYLTRETDKDLAGEGVRGLSKRKSIDIRNRLKLIHEKEADLFVTIHLNAIPATQWSGAQTFYSDVLPENKHLATMIQDEIIRNLENTKRVPLEMNQMYLLKYAEVPGALVEIGFLSNEVERELLKDKAYQQKMAASIYQGIIRYVTEDVEKAKETSQ